jgi:hypothetical protein
MLIAIIKKHTRRRPIQSQMGKQDNYKRITRQKEAMQRQIFNVLHTKCFRNKLYRVSS